MATGDGLLVRIKPPGGLLTSAQATLIANLAERHGNGEIELTGRGSLQVRGLSPCSAPPFAAAIVGAGLACADPEAERRRTVLASPLAGADPAVAPETAGLAAALESALAARSGLCALPAKFGVLVDGGGILPLTGFEADIEIRVGERCAVSIAGAEAAAILDPADAVAAVLRLAHAFVRLAGGERRMRALVHARGEAAVFAAAGLAPRAALPARPSPSPIGFTAYAPGEGAGGAGLPFGAITARGLAALASLAERFGEAALRLTPWRAVMLARVPRADAGALGAALDALGLITSGEDPRLRVAACAGQPGCASATVATRALAAALATPSLRGVVHVSGCSKGCAHPGPAPVTLVGRDGRFDLVRQGRAGDAPDRGAD